MNIEYEIRYAVHPADFKGYDTERLRKEFLVPGLFVRDKIKMVYSMYDRFIIGGVLPVSSPLLLEPVDALKAPFFLSRREIGIINVGEEGVVKTDGKEYALGFKEALYLGAGERNVVFESRHSSRPARFYFNSAPAHTSYPDKLITRADAEVAELGAPETSNFRRLNKLIVNSIVKTCQLQMGLTELQPGSVWNTMPPHTHARRMEAYFYFEVPGGQAVCHFMGEPTETRHIWMANEEAVLSPQWSIHSAAGTGNYSFIWGMAGENLDYGDMDTVTPDRLR